MSNPSGRKSLILVLVLVLIFGLAAALLAGPRMPGSGQNNSKPHVMRVYGSRHPHGHGSIQLKATCTANCPGGKTISCQGPEVSCIDNSGCYDANDTTLNWHSCPGSELELQ